ncbi:AAA family ATPase [Candidatus Dojkabacteria bacterium]|nr:AAA family ATPase [Candidatus Dojkabacteria bacterium]
MSTQPAQNTQIDISQLPEIQTLLDQVNSASIPNELKEKLRTMASRLVIAAKSGVYSSEFESIKKYADWIMAIPWSNYTEDNLNIQDVEAKLNAGHYGLENVKARLLEYLAVLKLNTQNTQTAENPALEATAPEIKSIATNAPILCFVGIQGVGKTSMARSIASALGRQFVRISLGALGESTALRGRSRADKNPEPGEIVKALVRTRVMNPVILLDEIDKVSSETGLRADVMAALLEILDPEQNSTFRDHYIDYPVDLSKVLFIFTANNLGGVSSALLDRLEIIRFSSYSLDDKKIIAQKYLLPKVRKATGLTEAQLQFSDDVWDLIIRPLGFDAGVRQLERNLMELARKVAKRIVDGIAPSVMITPQNFREFIPQDIDVYT